MCLILLIASRLRVGFSIHDLRSFRSDEDVIEYLVSQCVSLQGLITTCSSVVEWRLVCKRFRNKLSQLRICWNTSLFFYSLFLSI